MSGKKKKYVQCCEICLWIKRHGSKALNLSPDKFHRSYYSSSSFLVHAGIFFFLTRWYRITNYGHSAKVKLFKWIFLYKIINMLNSAGKREKLWIKRWNIVIFFFCIKLWDQLRKTLSTNRATIVQCTIVHPLTGKTSNNDGWQNEDSIWEPMLEWIICSA